MHMTDYRTHHTLAKDLPDDRLAYAVVHDDRTLEFLHRDGFIDLGMLHDIAEISRHMSRSGVITMAERGAEGEMVSTTVEAWLELVPGEHLPLNMIGLRVRWDGPKLLIEVRVRQGYIAREMVREMNEQAMPMCGEVLHTTGRPPKMAPDIFSIADVV